MTARCMLIARAQINGAVREPGFEFTLAAGEKGPMRTTVASDHGANPGGHWRHGAAVRPGAMREDPLYVVLAEPVDAPKPGDD